jgi:hypothetical protein
MASTNKGFIPQLRGVDPNDAGVVAAREAAAKFGMLKFLCSNPKPIRRAGGSVFFLYVVNFNNQDEYEAYADVMDNVRVDGADGTPRTALIQDPVTQQVLFASPVWQGNSFEIAWTSGAPGKNPLGRFVPNDMDALARGSAEQNTMINQERAKLIAARGVGKIGRLALVRGNNNQNDESELSPEQLQAQIEAARMDNVTAGAGEQPGGGGQTPAQDGK